MLKWFYNLIKQCLKMLRGKWSRKICKHSCLFCENWEDCRFIEDIDGIATEVSKGYDVGYKDGLAENKLNKIKKTVLYDLYTEAPSREKIIQACNQCKEFNDFINRVFNNYLS